ncbi:sensor histidine kinase [Uliginosibacterium sp. sgz301328]|uniref:sensor histidine kinase n=1 Tax=Uliginosibacterium sp. sgz301328 TaxID=3243764 RepID=UPI00359EF407
MPDALPRGSVAMALAAAAGVALAAAEPLTWWGWLCVIVIWVAVAWLFAAARHGQAADAVEADARTASAPAAAGPALPDEEADERMRFIAAAGHDLRQPLQAISLFAATLNTHDLPPPARQIGHNLEASAEALSTLFEEVMALARLSADREYFAERPVSLRALLSAAVANHLDDAHDHGLHLRHVDTRLRVLADEPQLARALDRLIAHAVAVSEGGGVLVGCRAREGRVLIQVWDTGEGIPESQLAHLFEPFSPYGKRFDDRALGLVMAFRIARRMGGELTVRSVPGKGSVFSLSLPRVARASQ